MVINAWRDVLSISTAERASAGVGNNRAAIVAPMPLVYRTSYNKAVALAREQLGAKAFQEIWAEGHALTLEQVAIL